MLDGDPVGRALSATIERQKAEIVRLRVINDAMLHYLETALKLDAIDDFKMKFSGSFVPLAECLSRWRPNDQQSTDR